MFFFFGPLKFEQIVGNILEYHGYEVVRNYQIKRGNHIVDIIAKDNENGIVYVIEVKNNGSFEMLLSASTQVREAFLDYKELSKGSRNVDIKAVVVVPNKISDENRRYLAEKYPDIIYLDISNLLYAVQNNDSLMVELKGLLDYSVENIAPRKWALSLINKSSKREANVADEYIAALEACKPGNADAKKYEKACVNALDYVFSDAFMKLKPQTYSNDNLYIFDAICRLKYDSQGSFCSIVKHNFLSQYIIFEFKNYNEKISQSEVYTTERYLYAKALRCVAIIISQNGASDHARWAAKGCLRENGKLILLLETKDLIKMIEKKERKEDPTEYLMDKLEELLIELEK